MKVAVYNRYWPTAGGGEKYAASVAQALAADHDVDLLGYDEIDPSMLEERLDVDLTDVGTRIIEHDRVGALASASAGYDLLVNSSYMSSERSGARHALYVVLFPTAFDHGLTTKQWLATRTLGRVVRPPAAVEWDEGFHGVEVARFRRYRWTSESGALRLLAPAGKVLPVRLVFGPRPPAAGPTDVEVEVDGEPVGRVTVGTDETTYSIDFSAAGRGPDDPVTVTLRSSRVFVPRDVYGPGTDDGRRLGACLLSVRVGRGLAAGLAARHPVLGSPPPDLRFLDTYDRVIAISTFTQHFVRELWGRESDIVYPVVSPLREAPEKEPLILSVGRFFDRRLGHSKKQLELVEGFRRLVQRGLRGWEYHLVGGCSPEHAPYLERVRRAAEGLPVHFHVDAPGAVVRDLYARASVFWHGTGLGENERRHPHRFEHFGISTVEAMSAGGVAIVVGRAGQAEIVEHGVSGFHFKTLDELVELTWEVARDATLRRAVSEAAKIRARDFGPEAFSDRLREIVAAVVREPDTPAVGA